MESGLRCGTCISSRLSGASPALFVISCCHGAMTRWTAEISGLAKRQRTRLNAWRWMPEILDEKEMAATRIFTTGPPAVRPPQSLAKFARSWIAIVHEATEYRPEVRLLRRRLVQERRPRFHGAEEDRQGERGSRVSR